MSDADSSRINLCLETHDDARGGEFLYALMDCGAGDSGLAGYLEERFAGVVREHLENLEVESIIMLTCHVTDISDSKLNNR